MAWVFRTLHSSVAARVFAAFLGGLGGLLIYYLARLIGARKRISALAGLLYVLSGVAAANGRLSHNDLYLQLFTILSVYSVIQYQHSGTKSWLYTSFFVVRLAASSKFTGGSLILLPVVSFLILHWAEIRSRWLSMFGSLFLGGLVSYLGYALGTPKSLLAPVYYFSHVIPALQNYPQYGFNSGAKIGLFGQWAVLENAVGTFAYYLFIPVLLWFAVRWILWRMGRTPLDDRRGQGVGILILIVLIFDLPFMISINYIEGYFIPFVPFLAILSAFFIEELVDFAKGRGWKFAQPVIKKETFSRAHNYPIYFVKCPTSVVPTGGRYEYNLGEQGLLDRDTDYFVVDSYTNWRFYTESVCDQSGGM